MSLLKTEHFLAYVNSKASGGVRMNFTFEHLQEWEISLPPIEVQLEVVAQIERQQAIIDGTEKIIRNWKVDDEYFIGTFKKIDEFAIVRTGSTPPRDNPENFIGNNNWVLTNEIEDCEIFDSEEKLSDTAINKYSLTTYPINTILVAMYGQGKTRGRSGILKIPAAITQNCAAILVNEEIVNPYYVWYFLLSIYEQIRGKDYSGGVPHLNLTIMKDIQVPIPDLNIQNEIVSKIESKMKTLAEIRQMKTEAQAKIDKLINSIWESS
ncbi:MAG: restriction endonuclease subunit S [Methylococcaceae bacterium]